MRPILTAAAMRAVERRVIDAGTPSLELMERAGASAAVAAWRFGLPREVNILCGTGNNGGDGYVVARHLAERGHDVRVIAAAPLRSADARAMSARWAGPVLAYGEAKPAAGFIDALFGIGLDRPLEVGDVAELQRLGANARTRIAIDLPSGVGSDDGALFGVPFVFDLTVTFGANKPAHIIEPARSCCGRVVVADIGLGAIDSKTRCNAPPRLRAAVADVHKYERGSVIVIAGPAGAGGAARLAARAALRAGAGLATLACQPLALPENAARLDAVMLRVTPDVAALARVLTDRRIGAVVIGPGLGQDAAAKAKLAAVLASEVATVCDADAFTLCAGEPEALRNAAVLTPHEGEFVRMFGNLPGSRIDRALAAAARAGTVVVLKGPDTVIAAPDGRAVVNTHASPALATAGSGDVLAGIIAGLLAQGMAPFDAACAGVWIHGDAGLRGGTGLIAEDLPELLPAVLQGLA
ncbi:NAD(P)H-hydrate dehydratase [Polymorphobacter arshaanensis]|uniref:Bifunctional NAD(P)H-hydrate repair enzyme n=2 Tax=Glacieibacterium arshaanense TaxID=2511025 RepID=A0A4Y9ESU1_9SPHN|nr:NAD(P)H-hydrate dehydratase [Polymorphobacter arshaanensis]TFU06380.1 NAD(P)H-hydrate dehydratase [Polymorphobacter arshaanensis]